MYWCFFIVCFLLSGTIAYSWLGDQPLVFAPLQPLGAYPWKAYVHPGDGHMPMPGMHWLAASFTALRRGESSAQSAVLQPFQLHGGAYNFGGLAKSHLFLPPSLHIGEGLPFHGQIPANNTVNSEFVVGIKPGDSGVVIRYQVDKHTHTWSTEYFVAYSHIYPGFMGVMKLCLIMMMMPDVLIRFLFILSAW